MDMHLTHVLRRTHPNRTASSLGRRRRLGAAALACVVVALVAACSSASSQTSGDGASATSTPPTVATSIPDGLTLRVGDQLGYLQQSLKISGQDQDLPYAVEYSSFVGGPPMLQAFQGDAIDVGFVASTPLIFAQAAGQGIVAVAGWAPEHSATRLVAASDAGISSWGDLKGKKVAYQVGTSAESAVLQGLQSAGLELSDVTSVNLPITQITAALQGGSADIGVLYEPLTSSFIAQSPGFEVVLTPDAVTDRGTFLIASQTALADSGLSAAIGDYVQRLVRSTAFANAHPEAWAQAFYVGEYKLPIDQGLKLLEAAGTTSFLELPGDLVEPQQNLADLYLANGEIPEQLDVSRQFDSRYNAIVQQALADAATQQPVAP
jgi:sulfonate transport system substrate-binding protein